jgi:hypothetical protein
MTRRACAFTLVVEVRGSACRSARCFRPATHPAPIRHPVHARARAVSKSAPQLTAQNGAPLPAEECVGVSGGGVNPQLNRRFDFVGSYHPRTGSVIMEKVYAPLMVSARGRCHRPLYSHTPPSHAL